MTKKVGQKPLPLTVDDAIDVFGGDEDRATKFFHDALFYGVKNKARFLLCRFIEKMTEDDATRLLHRVLKEAGLRRPLKSRVKAA